MDKLHRSVFVAHPCYTGRLPSNLQAERPAVATENLPAIACRYPHPVDIHAVFLIS